MSRTNQVVNLLAVLIPPTAFGLTVGFHRMLTHRSFQAKKWLEYTFVVLGEMAVQGPVIHWVADHRKHHAHADEEGDPHSPHLVGDGVRGVLLGLYHAHIGWLFSEQGRADRKKYAKDLIEEPGMRRLSKLFPVIVVAGLLIPAAIAYAVEGTLVAA